MVNWITLAQRFKSFISFPVQESFFATDFRFNEYNQSISWALALFSLFVILGGSAVGWYEQSWSHS